VRNSSKAVTSLALSLEAARPTGAHGMPTPPTSPHIKGPMKLTILELRTGRKPRHQLRNSKVNSGSLRNSSHVDGARRNDATNSTRPNPSPGLIPAETPPATEQRESSYTYLHIMILHLHIPFTNPFIPDQSKPWSKYCRLVHTSKTRYISEE
jgi:hypothetical protein